MRIYKYELKMTGLNQIKIPAGANVFSVGLDPADRLCIWALVDPEETKEDVREFMVAGTGWDLQDELSKHLSANFLGTVRQQPYMWHVWEVFEW